MKWSKKLENLFSATAFAEEGEFETAREIAAENDGPAGSSTVSNTRPATRNVSPIKPRRAPSKA